MNFPAVEAAVIAFTERVNRDLGREAVKPVIMETPTPPPDELHLNRLIAWCYGFFFEAAVDVLKECKALMKQGAPERTNRYAHGTRLINCLRTYKFHNLPPGAENDKKKAVAKAWLVDFEQSSEGMALASEKFCSDVISLIEDLMQVWVASTTDPTDAAQLVRRVNHSLDQFWPPHEVDDMIRQAADEIQLQGFDAKAFREENLSEWRKVAACFEDRETGAVGIRRAIRLTMHQTFGARP